ncbi:MAG: hypothetical protein K0V04_46160 [Deltaproteobacteria bacterium]|nr:hypothetical protein [Deltaproteobacteria bacterium]
MSSEIEIAKSGRAACRVCGKKIAKGEHRLGIEYESEYGTSYRWHHLSCAAERLPNELRPALDEWTDELPQRQELLTTMEGVDSPDASSDGVDYPDYPSASLAPSARARCTECGESIGKGDVRVEIEHEVEVNDSRRTVTGYLHPACTPQWARDNWTEAVSFADTLRHNATVDVPAAAFVELAAAEVVERPPFEGVDERLLLSIANKFRKASDPNGFEHGEALDAVDYALREPLLWYLARHDLCDAHKDPGMWRLLAEASEHFDLEATVELLCRVPAVFAALYGSYSADSILPDWSSELQSLVAQALRADEPRVRERLSDMRANVRRGVCLVLAMRGQSVPEPERAPLARALAHRAAHDYPQYVDDVLDDDAEQRMFDPGPIASALDAESWRQTLQEEAERHQWYDAGLVRDALLAMPRATFIRSVLRAEGGDMEAAAFVRLCEDRGDSAPELVETLMAQPEDDRSGSHYERMLTATMARCPGQVPPGAEDQLDFLAMNPDRSDGAEAIDRYDRALRALGDERIDALARRLLKSHMASRAAAPLSVRFDAEVYAQIFEDPKAYLSASWLALPGPQVVPHLLTALKAVGESDRSKPILSALMRALAAAATAGQPVDGPMLDLLGLGALDDPSTAVLDQLGTILPAVEPEALAAFVRRHLDSADRPEQILWGAAHSRDTALRGQAMAALVDRRSSIDSIEILRRAIGVLGADALPMLREHIGRSNGDRTFLSRLEKVLSDKDVATLAEAQGLAEESPLQTMQRLAEASRKRERIYVFDTDRSLASPRPDGLTCHGGAAPAGVHVPTHDGEPLSHILTLDLQEAPELGALYPGKRALSLFLRSPGRGTFNDEGVVVLTAEPGARGQGSKPFALVALDVPTSVFSSRARKAEIKQLRGLLFNRAGYALGEPMWIQSSDPQGQFLFQFDDHFDVNLGDSGEMYVWSSGTSWQCY